MTKECPSCHQNIEVLEANFGSLFTCSSCSAVYFINFDGDPESSDLQVEVHDAMGNVPEPSPHFSDSILDDPQIHLNDESPSNDEPAVESTNDNQNEEELSSNSIQEINEFANSTDSNLTGLKYRVVIHGIDSKILLQEVKEALEDTRFNWDVGIILSQRKNGAIELKPLPPVKAILIIQRLRLSGLEFMWEEIND